MKVTGIIAEYNPFHSGHEYHLKKARELTNADYVLVVMSGNFTQRGTPALMNKYLRTEMALSCGADLVLELPVWFATGSAEYFTFGAVSLLHKIGVTDALVFGSEGGSSEELTALARLLLEEPAEYRRLLKASLKKGNSYPKARSEALQTLFPKLSVELLSLPNNILGLEYCRAIYSFGSSMEPIALPRVHCGYHDKTLAKEGEFSSASAIRAHLLSDAPKGLSGTSAVTSDFMANTFAATLSDAMPVSCLNILKKFWGQAAPMESRDFSPLLKYKLLAEGSAPLSRYADINADLDQRIKNHLNQFTDFESFCGLLKNKSLTHSRISRGLLHILLNIEAEDLLSLKEKGFAQYARILGFRREAAPLLTAIKQNASIPMISKLADASELLNEEASTMLEKDIFASHVYETVAADKFHQEFRNEYQRPMIVI